MRVFIAEKPSLATAIFKGLGGNPSTDKKAGYYEKGSDIVTWCFGHLLSLKDPEDYDSNLKRWTLDSLPIQTRFPPQYKPRPDSKKQLDTVIGFIKKADRIVHAGDPDPEGCLLIDEILDHVGNTKPVERLLIADLNDKPVKKALANMQPNANFRPQTNKALARSIADQSFGYNLTRSYTLKAREKGFESVLNIGRVISSLIGMVNQRTLANQNHTLSQYYELWGTFGVEGHKIKGKLQPDDNLESDEKGRLTDKQQLEVIKEAELGEKGTIQNVETKEEKRQPPMPFNLSKLQITASKKWGYKPKETLDIVQKLYETHKLLTYPRSDNQYLSDSHLENASDILNAIKKTMPSLARDIEQTQPTSTHKAFDASKIEAHHAIVPTEKSGEGVTLTDKEKNIYELVSKHFIGLFFPESVREKTTVHVSCCLGRLYRATQTSVLSQGWERLFKGEESTDAKNESVGDLSALTQGQQGACEHTELLTKETQPPKYFDDAGLLKAMTEAAKFVQDPVLRKQLEAKDKNTKGENGSIGTEATRSGHIEKLGSLKHLILVGKEKGYKNPVYKTTEAGQEFCALLPPEIIMPDISAIWEGDLDKIGKGQHSVVEFVKTVDAYIQDRVKQVKAEGVPITIKDGVTCPTCQSGLLLKRKGKNGVFHACNRYPDCKTTFPDDNGKPNLTPKPKVEQPKASDSECCPECKKGLIRRAGKREGSFWWGCSGFPTCKVRFFDKDGKPDRDKGAL
ncbi:DNA topoisomerase III [Vibrio chagasii]|uniref:DNA topoisomerase III n=1 Tax=Vibrio chagasii TaxID=170679 RepID=UPI002284B395|nr:DNA topoisomerase III [Vibrio chagasii]MCY9828807.1 DNA topoisomerase III [Vibrio chagasii]